MYFINPIVLYGALVLLVGLLMLIWRRLAQSSEFKAAADLAAKTLLVIGITWMLIGTGLGARHLVAHAECKATSTETEYAKGCKYFIEKYGL